MKKIILTGGGSAGHVTPNLALLPALKAAGYEAYYIGGENGIERELAEKAGVMFYAISTGKLRRDKLLSIKNISDIFSAIGGVADAARVIKRVKPDVIFSKGGFVGLPVAVAGWVCRVRVVLHESDISSGLANRLSMPFASSICASFPETAAHLSAKKAVLTGNPIREELLTGDSARGLRLCGFNGSKPVILVTGGSLGSQAINEALRAALPLLLPEFDIVHLCGKGKLDGNLPASQGYVQFEYADSELRDLFAASSFVISRAGSNSINEFLALRKPSLLIPLANRATRGDQVQNAASFEKQGFSMILPESQLSPQSLSDAVKMLYRDRDEYITNMEASAQGDAIRRIVEVISR